MMKKWMTTISGSAILLSSNIVMAHPVNSSTSFLSGLIHPLSGLDHLIGILLIGSLAWKMGTSNRWQLPLLFILMMGTGLIASQQGFYHPLAEWFIIALLVILGFMITCSKKLSIGATAPIITLFAIQHGLSHGHEMLATTIAWQYALGVILTTSLIILSGALITGYIHQVRIRIYRPAVNQTERATKRMR